MKIKLLAAFILSSLALNVSAMELNNAILLDSKVTKTDSVIDGHFEDIDGASSATNGASVDASVGNVQGWEKTNTQVSGRHSYSVTNNSKVKQIYAIEYIICSRSDACLTRVDHIAINPSGSASGSASSTILTYFDNPGVFQSSASSKINGESVAYKKATGEVKINKK